jgi:hypothetical protein
MPNPVISALTYTVTDTTIVATWTTDIAADSNIHAGAKAGIDNGVAASGTSHQAIVTGLLPNTLYSCTVTSGATTSTPQNVTTNVAQTRIPILSATDSGVQGTFGNASGGDSLYSFVSNDGSTYVSMNDGYGLTGTANAGANLQVGKFTNETTFAGSLVNILSNYLGVNTSDGTDGPGGTPMQGKSYGVFGINGNLFVFTNRQDNVSANWDGNIIKSTDHGATWNNWTTPTTFNANGSRPAAGTYEYAQSTYGFSDPVLYAADDGTLGYNTAGNQIDGANGFVYITFRDSADLTHLYLMRIPRIQFDAQNSASFQYWIGPAYPTPTDFVTDTNWTASDTGKTAIYTTVFNGYGGRVFFVPTINRYVLLDNVPSSSGSDVWYFYEAPTPAGPWLQIYTQVNTSTGWIVPSFMHRDVLSNVATNNISLRMLYAGTYPTYYQPRWSTLTLKTSGATPPVNQFIQGAASAFHTAVSTFPLAYIGNVTKGNLLVVAWYRTLAHAITQVKGSLNTTNWNIVYDTADGSGYAAGGWAWIFSTATGAETVTVTAGGNVNGCTAIGEWSGPDSLRGASVATANQTTAIRTSPTISALAGDLLVGINELVSGGGTGAANTPWALREASVTSSNYVAGIEDQLSTITSTPQASFTTSLFANAYDSTTGIGVFNATEHFISGSAGIAGATVSYSGTENGSVIADISGNYTIPLYNGSYIITPSKTGYTFSPTSANETVSGADITGVDFAGTLATVSYSHHFHGIDADASTVNSHFHNIDADIAYASSTAHNIDAYTILTPSQKIVRNILVSRSCAASVLVNRS